MEEFKSIEDLMQIDEKHLLMGAVNGQVPTIERMHAYLENETLNPLVPEEIRDQFNVARNMAMYSYFFYAIAPEVQFKTYVLMEYALATKADSKKNLSFKQLLGIAIGENWISDEGFRHLHHPSDENLWCKSLVKILPDLRNPHAHSPGLLVGDCLFHISVCTDFINQLFAEKSHGGFRN